MEKGLTSLQLLIGDRIAREGTGQGDNTLRPTTWDVHELKGQQARLRLVDASDSNGGYILIDHILFTDKTNPVFPDATRDGRPFTPGSIITDALPGVTIPEGSRLEIFATHEEHGIYSPTALCLDESGQLLVTETHRFRYGIPDNRNHRYWHTDDISALTVEDRRAMHQKWDEKYPISEMTKKSEKIRLLADTDGDGKADKKFTFDAFEIGQYLYPADTEGVPSCASRTSLPSSDPRASAARSYSPPRKAPAAIS